MKVYIVLRGENHQGGSVEGVFSNKEDALERQEDIEAQPGFVGCDFVSIEEWEIS